MGLRPNTLSCIALLLLVHYSHLCLYKGSLLYYIIHIIQYTDFQSLTRINITKNNKEVTKVMPRQQKQIDPRLQRKDRVERKTPQGGKNIFYTTNNYLIARLLTLSSESSPTEISRQVSVFFCKCP
jgi:hypothetical protein